MDETILVGADIFFEGLAITHLIAENFRWDFWLNNLKLKVLHTDLCGYPNSFHSLTIINNE